VVVQGHAGGLGYYAAAEFLQPQHHRPWGMSDLFSHGVFFPTFAKKFSQKLTGFTNLWGGIVNVLEKLLTVVFG
jgi:hypothetical protein